MPSPTETNLKINTMDSKKNKSSNEDNSSDRAKNLRDFFVDGLKDIQQHRFWKREVKPQIPA